jgi:hypothetical protein
MPELSLKDWGLVLVLLKLQKHDPNAAIDLLRDAAPKIDRSWLRSSIMQL